LDATFGNNGVLLDIGLQNVYSKAPFKVNNKYFTTGGVIYPNSTEINNTILISFNDNGDLNTSFNNQGFYIDDSITLGDAASDMFILPNNKILIVGATIINQTSSKVFVKRYVDNTLNNTFFTKKDVSYINPVKDKIVFKSVQKINKVEIFNVTGEKIIESNESTFFINEFVQGLYFAKIYFEDQTVLNKKIIKE
jgi:hypothetical protein